MEPKERKNESTSRRVSESTKKEYAKPEVIHELELETRAGSPLSIPGDLLDWGLLGE